MSRFKHRDIRLTARIPAPPEKVYEAFTSPKALRSWWVEEAESEPRNLGRVRLVWRESARVTGRSKSAWFREARGVYVDLEPGRKVAWVWDRRGLPAGVPSLTTVFIEPAGGQEADVTVLHAGFPAASKTSAAACERLWSDCLARLQARFTTRPRRRPSSAPAAS